MTPSKKKATVTARLKIKDLKPKKDPKGGPIYVNYLKLDDKT
jgi:hypothetical protein